MISDTNRSGLKNDFGTRLVLSSSIPTFVAFVRISDEQIESLIASSSSIGKTRMSQSVEAFIF